MIQNPGGSLTSHLATICMIGGVLFMISRSPAVRRTLRHRAHQVHEYFFHESERTVQVVKEETPGTSTTGASQPRTPLEQIEPRGWDYSIYERANPPA